MDVLSNSSLTLALFVIVLSFASTILSNRLRVSYVTILVIMGFALSFLKVPTGLGGIPFDRSIVLGLIVPPLIFESAMRTRFETFRAVQKTVLSLAVLGVIISAVVSAFILNVLVGLPLAVAFLFGVIIAPTDTVSILSVMKRAHAPERLTTILETESYFNNATPVILYPIALSLSFNPIQDLGSFAYMLLGGVTVGLLVSGIAELLHRMITDPLAETSFTVAVMYGSYILAESLGASGLIAVPIAGLYMGNRTMRTAMSEETRRTMVSFWEVVTFMATSFAFVLLGLNTDFALLVRYAPLIVGAFLILVLARAISVYPIVGMTRLLGEKIPQSWTNVLAAAGIRGTVSAALALSLPESPFKGLVVAMTFGVALLSLIIQVEFMQLYMDRTKLAENS